VSFDDAPVTCRTPLSLELTRGVAQTVTAPLYRDGAAVTATAAAARLYDAAGTLVDSEASALSGGVATWTLTPAATLSLGMGWRMEWDVTHAGGVVRHQTAAALVRRAIYPVITDADLFRRDRTLDPTEAGYRGPESYTDLQEYLDEAWTEIVGRVYAQGDRPSLIMSPEALRAPHLYLTLAIIYRAMGSERAGLASEYQHMYEAAWDSLRWVYDSDDDGIPDNDGARRAATPTLWLV
jgi:hypothetical protein